MRYYFLGSEEEHIINISQAEILNNKTVKVSFGEDEDKTEYIIRRLADKYFYSTDGVKWQKLCPLVKTDSFVSAGKVFKTYRGYKPSGLGSANDGELLTQMPGKVVSINVKVGDPIKKGSTVLVLEAMKMENEIKAPKDGVIGKIHVNIGDALDQGVLMVEINEEN